MLIRVAACGICGHDTADREGLTHVDGPAILGHEIAGTVEAVGDGVTGVAVGDRVTTKQYTGCGECDACRAERDLDCPHVRFNYGGNAELVAIDANSILPVPEGVSLTDASVVACAVGSVYHALTARAAVRPGETVVVAGAGGGLGVHAVQVAQALGAHVVAVTSSPKKVPRLQALGVAYVVHAADGYWRTLLERTDGAGAAVVLDTVGHPDGFSNCFRALAQGGRYVFVGQVYADPVRLYPAFVLGKEAVVTGSRSTPNDAFRAAAELVATGRVQVVSELFPLERVAAAHEALARGEVVGRAVLVVGQR